MKKLILDTSILKKNANFRAIFIARLISIVSLGMLTVSVPVQVHEMTGSSLQVGLILALDGVGMFIGLLLGGSLADRYERRKQILLGRAACGIGFAALAANCFIAEPSLTALYILSLWSGFFGAIGLTALMASIPQLVGRENIAAAGALSMLTVRLGTVISPAIGGLIISLTDISWNYSIAAIGTFMTLIPLSHLPKMQAKQQKPESSLQSLIGGLKFVLRDKVVGGIAAMGMLDSLGKGIRVLFPALVTITFGGGAFEIGLMYSAFPLGATLGAFTSGWVKTLTKPGFSMMLCSIIAFASLALIPIGNNLYFALALLVIYGYLTSISSLLQYTLLQNHTPDHLLGRANSLWTAQNVTGDSAGAATLGALSKIFSAPLSALYFSASVGLVSCLALISFKTLRKTSFHPKNKEDLTASEVMADNKDTTSSTVTATNTKATASSK